MQIRIPRRRGNRWRADFFQQLAPLQRAAPHVEVTALLSASERVGDGDIEAAAGLKRLLDGVQPGRLNVRDDRFHAENRLGAAMKNI